MKILPLGLGVLTLLLAGIIFSEWPQTINQEKNTLLPSAENELPWQIDLLDSGHTRVFGLTIQQTTLQYIREQRAPDMQLALIVSNESHPLLEAYIEQINLGFITGKLVLNAELPQDVLKNMGERARKISLLPSGARRATLSQQDIPLALSAKISAISFIPSVNLEEATVLQRFGIPEERLRDKNNTHAEHFLYPKKGLDLLLDNKGKELLQYVSPQQFSRLRDPLLPP